MESHNLDKIDQLLEEFNDQRAQLKDMISEVEMIKNKVDKLIPDATTTKDSDYRNFVTGSRYMSLFEQRVKSITEFFRIILDMRKEISKTIKDEIELRRKTNLGVDSDITDLVNISELADKIEKINKYKVDVKTKINKMNC